MNVATALDERVSDRRTPTLRFTPLSLGILLTIAGLAIRLVDVGSRPLWLDEAFSEWFSDHSFHYLWHVLPTYEAHPPFYYSVLREWRLLAGTSHVAMRLLSVALGALTVPLVMGIAAEQERQAPSGHLVLRMATAGILTACSPLFLAISQEARPYPLLTFAYALAILAVLRLTEEFRRGNAGTWAAWLGLAASTLLTSWSHALGILYAMTLALALMPLWISAPVNRERLLRGSVTGAAIVLLYLPCLMLMSGRAHDWGTNWLRWDPVLFVPQLLALYTIPFEALNVASAIAALAMVLLLKRAITSIWVSHGWNVDRLLLLLWLGAPLLAALISAMVEPVFLARTLSGTLVPAYLLIAGSITRVKDDRERRILFSIIFICLIPSGIAMATRPATERWDLASAFLSQHARGNDQLWLYPADSALPLEAIGTRLPGVVRPLPEPFPTLHSAGPIRAGWRAVVSLSPAQAAQLASDPRLHEVPVIWLVSRQSDLFDPAADVPTALRKVRRAGAVQQWGYIGVQPFYR